MTTCYTAPIQERRGENGETAKAQSSPDGAPRRVFRQRAALSYAEGSPCRAPCEVVDFALQVAVEFDREPLQIGRIDAREVGPRQHCRRIWVKDCYRHLLARDLARDARLLVEQGPYAFGLTPVAAAAEAAVKSAPVAALHRRLRAGFARPLASRPALGPTRIADAPAIPRPFGETAYSGPIVVVPESGAARHGISYFLLRHPPPAPANSSLTQKIHVTSLDGSAYRVHSVAKSGSWRGSSLNRKL